MLKTHKKWKKCKQIEFGLCYSTCFSLYLFQFSFSHTRYSSNFQNLSALTQGPIRDQAIELVQVRFPLEGGTIPEGGYSGGEAFLKAEL